MRITARLIAAATLALPVFAHADPDEYVHVPAVEYGEKEIDFKYGTRAFRTDGEHERESAGSIGFGWGVKQWWFTEAYLKYHKEGSDTTSYDAFEWENKFQLTEPNKYPVDVGALIEFEVPKDHSTAGYEIKLGPLFQWDTGVLRWNFNPLFQRNVHTNDGESHHTEMGYESQVAYHLKSGMDLGVQAFGDMGEWNHWLASSEQSHRIGPMAAGKIKLGGRNQIRWNAAFLFGATHASPDNQFRLQAEYEF
jgi:hypothetical protein